MKLTVHAHHLVQPRDLAVFLGKHLVNPLRRLHDSPATRLTVQVEATRPGKGGADQACKLTFNMPNAKTLRVESV